MHHHNRHIGRRVRSHGFTLIEMLVVITVIGVLASIILVAASGVLGNARSAAVQRQLQAISDGIEQFENDIGHLPPLLTRRDGDDLLTVPVADSSPSAAFGRLRDARYHSLFTLGVYLLGTGDLDQRNATGGPSAQPFTGENTDRDDGAAGPGFRDPGPDLSWGGAEDREIQATEDTASKTGRVFGPYLDMSSMAEAIKLDGETGLFYIVDPWDQPIRYYKDWPTRDPTNNNIFSVDRVPIELRSGGAVEKHMASGEADLETDRPVLNARYMLLSAGAPLRFESDGTPIPLFGELKEGGTALQSSSDFEVGGSMNPSSLNADEQRWLLERLESNIRVSPS